MVSPSYPPRTGGGEKYAQRMNIALGDLNHEVTILTAVPDLIGRRSDGQTNIRYVNARRLVGFPFFSLAVLISMIRSTRADIILAYGPSPYDIITSVVSRLFRLPYIQVYHADFDEKRVHTRLATLVHNVVALRLSQMIVCTNQKMRERLAKRGLSAKTTLLTPGVDQMFFRARYRDRDRDCHYDLVFVGALDRDHYYKRLDLLLEAVAAISKTDKSIRLRVVGDGDRRASFEKLAADLGVREAVHFLGRVSDEELAQIYSQSRVLVLPSPTAQEGFGLVCLEAMAAGLPVVCSRNAGAAAIVADAPGCTTWDGETVEDLARTVSAARHQQDCNLDLQGYARQFSWTTMVQGFDVELRRLLAD